MLVAVAVILADLALLSQSRGSVIAMPLTAVVLLVTLPGRVRLFGVLLVVGAAVGVALPTILDVSAAVRAGDAPPPVRSTPRSSCVCSALPWRGC